MSQVAHQGHHTGIRNVPEAAVCEILRLANLSLSRVTFHNLQFFLLMSEMEGL